MIEVQEPVPNMDVNELRNKVAVLTTKIDVLCNREQHGVILLALATELIAMINQMPDRLEVYTELKKVLVEASGLSILVLTRDLSTLVDTSSDS